MAFDDRAKEVERADNTYEYRVRLGSAGVGNPPENHAEQVEHVAVTFMVDYIHGLLLTSDIMLVSASYVGREEKSLLGRMKHLIT